MPAPTFQFRIAEIDARHDAPGTLIECLRFDTDGKQQKYGSILAFVEIQSALYVYERLLDTVHASITQARTMVTGLDGDPMVRFEKIIQKVNEALAAFVAAETNPILWHKVNLFIFQLAEEQLCFSGLGALSNAFLQQQPDGTTRAFDLLGSLEQPEQVDPQKPLASIVCGSMGMGDMLFVGTQSIQSVREKIDLISICKNQPPVAAAFEIQQRLQALRALEPHFGVLMAGVALTHAKAQKAVVAPQIIEEPLPTEPTASIHEFEQETEGILEQNSLTPSAGIRQFLESFKAKTDTLKGQFTRAQQPSVPVQEGLSDISLAGLRSMNSGYARGVLTEKRNTIIGGIAAFVVLLLAIFGIRSIQKGQAEQKLWMAVYDQSVQAKNKAEASLVYGNEDGARAQYVIALTAFNQLDQKTSDRKNARADLQKGLEDIHTRLQKTLIVQTPTVVADLQTNAQGLVLQNGNLYSIDQTQNQLRIVHLKDGSLDHVAAPSSTALRLVGNGQTSPLLIGNDHTLYTVKNNALVALSASSISKASSTTAITSYGRRVYVLDASNGMIWRYNAGAGGLSGETAYLKSPSMDDKLQSATSLSIDSNIYAATIGGISKFSAGERVNFSLTNIDPPLKQLTSIWSDVDSPSIIVADPQNKRVVIYNKDGKLIHQITSPVFQGPSAVWSDQATSALYVLDSGKIYKLDLPH